MANNFTKTEATHQLENAKVLSNGIFRYLNDADYNPVADYLALALTLAMAYQDLKALSVDDPYFEPHTLLTHLMPLAEAKVNGQQNDKSIPSEIH